MTAFFDSQADPHQAMFYVWGGDGDGTLSCICHLREYFSIQGVQRRDTRIYILMRKAKKRRDFDWDLSRCLAYQNIAELRLQPKMMFPSGDSWLVDHCAID